MMLIAINTIIYPRMLQTQQSVVEIHRLGQARLAVKQIANAISEVAASTGPSKQTIWIFLDSNIRIFCDKDKALIKFKVPMKLDYAFSIIEGTETIGSCNMQICEGAEKIYLPTALKLNCDNFKLCDTSANPPCNGEGDHIDGSIHKKAKITVIKHFLSGEALIQVNADAATPGG